MSSRIQIAVDPDFIHDRDYIRRLISKKAGTPVDTFTILRRSVDARSKRPHYVLQVAPGDGAETTTSAIAADAWKPVRRGLSVVIVGSGPAGYFAALESIRLGIRPVMLERGQSVDTRGKVIARLLRHGSVDRDTNYCFGEGGAGTYSDGKLYTQATKRGDVGGILDILVAHGASPEIRVDAQPHIGSNKLPALVGDLRRTVTSCGGEVHFGAKVTDFLIHTGRIEGVVTEDGRTFEADAVILACGHSAREIFDFFRKKELAVSAKPIAVGVRLEHPQRLIDALQYHHTPRHPNLPPAAYRFASRIDGRGVYSFCMCPGGLVVPASTAPGELVINGMSYAKRNSPFANAGIVVEIRVDDVREFRAEDHYAMLAFQKDLEQRAFAMGGGIGQRAPAQRLTDFVEGNISANLPAASSLPGVVAAPVHSLFPAPVYERLKAGLVSFGQKRRGFFTEEALVLAVESRTSSPLTLPRDRPSGMHPDVEGLFPCGEGAGHAGGIVSSAMDGQATARKVAESLGKR